MAEAADELSITMWLCLPEIKHTQIKYELSFTLALHVAQDELRHILLFMSFCALSS